MLPIQVLKVATNAAQLRELLKEGGLAAGKLGAFRDEHLVNLLNKGFSTLDMLATADEAMLTEPTPLPPALRRALVDKFNPPAPTASTGGSCSTCSARHEVLGGNTEQGSTDQECLRCVVDAVFGGQIMGTPYSCLLAVSLMADLMAV